MGDREDAASALSHMPRWVAVHENTLAKIEAVFAVAMNEGFQLDDMWDELSEARSERDQAVGRDEFAALQRQAEGDQ